MQSPTNFVTMVPSWSNHLLRVPVLARKFMFRSVLIANSRSNNLPQLLSFEQVCWLRVIYILYLSVYSLIYEISHCQNNSARNFHTNEFQLLQVWSSLLLRCYCYSITWELLIFESFKVISIEMNFIKYYLLFLFCYFFKKLSDFFKVPCKISRAQIFKYIIIIIILKILWHPIYKEDSVEYLQNDNSHFNILTRIWYYWNIFHIIRLFRLFYRHYL